MKSVSIMLLCLVPLFAQAQTPTPPVVYWGSTPCDTYIKGVLNIPASAPCEFLKWQLSLNGTDNGTQSFTLEIFYGESQPSTNGFRQGGNKLAMEGTYRITEVAKNDSRKTVYELKASSLEDQLFLVKLNNNLFHIVDSESKLLVGNGGYSYMLNKK